MSLLEKHRESMDRELFLGGMGREDDHHVPGRACGVFLGAEQPVLSAREVMRRWNRTNEGIKRRYRSRRHFNLVFVDEGGARRKFLPLRIGLPSLRANNGVLNRV